MEVYADCTFCINPPGPKGCPSSKGRITKALLYHLEAFTELGEDCLEPRYDDHRGLSWPHSLGVIWSLSFVVEKGGGEGAPGEHCMTVKPEVERGASWSRANLV